MILGSHNSWSYLPVRKWWLKPFAFMARCQRADIRTQYERYDVRCFDLHVRFDRYGLLHLVHGMFEYDPIALTSDLRYLNSMGDCYVRVIHDVRTRKQFETSHKSRFEEYCYNLETAFTCIRFWCGKNLYNWEEDYRFEYDPSCEEKYASVCPPRLIDDWWPWLYAKLHNRKIREKGTEKDILLIDYVNVMIEKEKSHAEVVAELYSRINTLEQSNSLMEKELERLRKKVKGLENVIDDKNMIIVHLKNRGFIERVFNL